MCIWAGAKGTSLGVFRPVQNVPAFVFVGRCGRYRVMCVWRWYEQYRFMYFWIGAKGGGLGVFLGRCDRFRVTCSLDRCKRYRFMCFSFCAKGTGANGAGLGVFGPVQKVPLHVLWSVAKCTGLCVGGPVQKAPVYVFSNRETFPVFVFLSRGEQYRFMYFGPGVKITGLSLFEPG